MAESQLTAISSKTLDLDQPPSHITGVESTMTKTIEDFAESLSTCTTSEILPLFEQGNYVIKIREIFVKRSVLGRQFLVMNADVLSSDRFAPSACSWAIGFNGWSAANSINSLLQVVDGRLDAGEARRSQFLSLLEDNRAVGLTTGLRISDNPPSRNGKTYQVATFFHPAPMANKTA